MPMYCGISGVKHKIAGLYTGVGGVKKELTEMWTAQGGVKKLVYRGTKYTGSLSVGETIMLDEQGVSTPYIVVNQGNPNSALYSSGADGTWVLRKFLLSDSMKYHADGMSRYDTSKVADFFATTFINRFQAEFKNRIHLVKVPFRSGGKDGTDTFGYFKVFLPSLTELGGEYPTAAVEGSALDYFDLTKESEIFERRKTGMTEHSNPLLYITRTPNTYYSTSDGYLWGIMGDGDQRGNFGASNFNFIRPVMVIDKDIEVEEDGTLLL